MSMSSLSIAPFAIAALFGLPACSGSPGGDIGPNEEAETPGDASPGRGGSPDAATACDGGDCVIADAGAEASAPRGFTLWRTLKPLDPVVIAQGVSADLGMTSGIPDLYGYQAEKVSGVENGTVTRFVGGIATEQMRFPGGGHGWEFSVVRRKNAPVVRFEHETGMVEVPWKAGASISAAQASSYEVAPLPPARPAIGDWLQGRVIMPDASEWRLYGVPFHPPPRLNGDNPNIPARLEYIVNHKIARTIDVRHLGRMPLTPTGTPIDKRLEPEGLSLIVLDGETRLMVAIVTGSVNTAHKIQLYTAPLAELTP
ncbi:MAG: hypothetical protein JWP97_6539 [Labilithrix sp.]|nr:hypothetical protein [Labilithrix sp.]